MLELFLAESNLLPIFLNISQLRSHMSMVTDSQFVLTSAIRHGQSWADQEHSPAWAAKSPPKFSEEMPEIELNEEEYEALPASSGSQSPISVFVGGLDYNLEARDLEEFFRAKGCKVSRVRIMKSNGKSSGKAILNVADKDALLAVTRLSGSTLSGRQLVIREDAGPKPARKPERTGSWRDSEQSKTRKEGGWHSVGKKAVEEPRDRRRERKEVKAPVVESEEPPKERKKLELKPRSKPLGEGSDANESARSSAIFGQAKPREERIVEKEEPVAEPKTTRRKERKPKEEAKVVEPVVVAPVKPTTKKPLNRFAIGDSSSSDEE